MNQSADYLFLRKLAESIEASTPGESVEGVSVRLLNIAERLAGLEAMEPRLRPDQAVSVMMTLGTAHISTVVEESEFARAKNPVILMGDVASSMYVRLLREKVRHEAAKAG